MALIPALLTGKVCAITGGLTGIGRAIAIAYLSHGACVSINYLASHNPAEAALLRSLLVDAQSAIEARKRPVAGNDTVPDKGAAAATQTASDVAEKDVSEPPLLLVPGDISRPETGLDLVAKTVERWGRLDVFVSNAGICQFSEFLAIKPELFQLHLQTNLSGAFYSVQAAAAQMAKQHEESLGASSSHQQQRGGGSIIAISSISALVGGAGQTHYTPTKAGVLSLMQSTACALGQYNIRCNALLPGTVRTQLNDQDLPDGSEKKAYMEGRIPLGRLGRPEDLAGPAVFLACDELSSYVTGASLLVDGGLFVNLQ